MSIKNLNTILKTYTNSIGIEFVLIPPGTFLMGCNYSSSDQKPAHPVTITKPFFIGKYPVTQEQWKRIMLYNPSYFLHNNLPVESVSWYETQEFIRQLNEKENTNKYRLPTEAEWEYACKAYTKTTWFFGENKELLDLYAWYADNAEGITQPVGQKRPNPWGLYDMYGNVLEWCQDWYKNKYNKASNKNPIGPRKGLSKVARGGSCNHSEKVTTSTYRKPFDPFAYKRYIGFRLIKSL